MAICCGSDSPYLINHKEHHVGRGWWPLLDKLHAGLMQVDPGYSVVQVKEKFGTLRIYLDGISRASQDLVFACETESGHVCEICGEPGVLLRDGWWHTLCDKHGEEKKARGFRAMLREQDD